MVRDGFAAATRQRASGDDTADDPVVVPAEDRALDPVDPVDAAEASERPAVAATGAAGRGVVPQPTAISAVRQRSARRGLFMLPSRWEGIDAGWKSELWSPSIPEFRGIGPFVADRKIGSAVSPDGHVPSAQV
ncbi:hypothetical protein Aph01nite_78330 [Acrocarpospora phusangensis]|uniref:Uncharacterized protein n=1 Tax=Acrocarpospora phusangensis TaxID=1070424 RepID=A0A919UT98_9ACTN|nr:hypothetical protein Aph01nite_78330 [Acrocarpospora phusangensis]